MRIFVPEPRPDRPPNPFTDRAFNVTFAHESGQPKYTLWGTFMAGGTDIKLPAGDHKIGWFNPRNGVPKMPVNLRGHTITAPDHEDWVAFIMIK